MNIARDVLTDPLTPTTPSLTLSLTDAGTNSADLPAYTFSGKAIGSPSATRRVIVALAFRATNSAAISSVTIGGVTAEKVVESRMGTTSASVASIWIATVPTGDTADVVVNLTASAARIGAAIYAADGLTSSTPYGTATATRAASLGSMTATMATTQAGFSIAAAFLSDSTNHRLTSAHRSTMAGSAVDHTVTAATTEAVWTSPLIEDTDVPTETPGSITTMALAVAGWS